MRKTIRIALTAGMFALVAACGGSGAPVEHAGEPLPSPGGAAGPFDDTVHVALGTERTVHDGRLAIRFLERVNDSRCPANAVCVRFGDARVRVRVRAGATTREETLVLGERTTSLAIGGYVVTATELHPYPGLHGEGAPQPAPWIVARVARP